MYIGYVWMVMVFKSKFKTHFMIAFAGSGAKIFWIVSR